MEIIHTDINGSYTPGIGDHKYLITFIDDYSNYGYNYRLHEKFQALYMFKIYKKEVEKQLNSEIKVVRSDRGVEYYGKFSRSRQNLDPLLCFCENMTFLFNT